ncbi:MAG: cysteine--tRNA ligase [Coriobacteriia bacterium]|nr:cysteine--tRNA ligase [Coriobacteriia bacterium]
MQIYNSAHHKKEEFIPQKEGVIKMYVCGPTVYDQIHIGNGRTFFSFDIIRRYLMWRGYDLTFVQNLTDVDDKIINRANENKQDPEELAKHFADSFNEVMKAFKVLPPDIQPRATLEINEMIQMISGLIEKGHAYESQGDVYFSVRSYPDYGHISHRNIDDLLVGARIEASDIKRDPLDFALWKKAKPGEPFWESPWGKGRPGWHSECSAMVHKYLGTPIDIHGGGSDLAFPHHENEAAQADACWEHGLAKYWMHSGMLQVNHEKMSKSLGNFYTLREILDTYSPDAVRLLMVQTHYRSTMDFSFDRLDGASSSLERLKTTMKNLSWHIDQLSDEKKDELSRESLDLQEASKRAREEFTEAMDDDFNSALATAGLFKLQSEINVYLDKIESSKADKSIALAAQDTLRELFGIFGIDINDDKVSYPQEIIELAKRFSDYEGSDTEEAARILLEVRQEARSQKEWSVADGIRDGLAELGLIVEDTDLGARVVKR